MNAINQSICRFVAEQGAATRIQIQTALGIGNVALRLRTLCRDGLIKMNGTSKNITYTVTDKQPDVPLVSSIAVSAIARVMKPGIAYSVPELARLLGKGVADVHQALGGETPGIEEIVQAYSKTRSYVLAGTRQQGVRESEPPAFLRGDYRQPGLLANNPRSHWAIAMSARSERC